VQRDSVRLWHVAATVPGIDLREAAQLTLLEDFARYYRELPFREEASPDRRYHLNNGPFAYADGITLYCMLCHARPRRIIEVGSGYSSAAMLDISELFFDNAVEFTFIDPEPQRLYSLMRADDRGRATVMECRVQDIPVSAFEALTANDILFIDGSHVAKIGSDVNYLLGEVLPALAAGVFVHIHDVPYPFEYFRAWVEQGIAWNEADLQPGLPDRVLQYLHGAFPPRVVRGTYAAVPPQHRRQPLAEAGRRDRGLAQESSGT
jgi:predicted O-methyltransferase YrrM